MLVQRLYVGQDVASVFRGQQTCLAQSGLHTKALVSGNLTEMLSAVTTLAGILDVPCSHHYLVGCEAIK